MQQGADELHFDSSLWCCGHGDEEIGSSASGSAWGKNPIDKSSAMENTGDDTDDSDDKADDEAGDEAGDDTDEKAGNRNEGEAIA